MTALCQTFMTKRLGKAGYTRLRQSVLYRNVSRELTFTWFSFTLLWFWSDWAKRAEGSAQLGATVSVLIWPVLLSVSTVVLGAWFLLFNWSMSVAESWGHVRDRHFRNNREHDHVAQFCLSADRVQELLTSAGGYFLVPENVAGGSRTPQKQPTPTPLGSLTHPFDE